MVSLEPFWYLTRSLYSHPKQIHNNFNVKKDSSGIYERRNILYMNPYRIYRMRNFEFWSFPPKADPPMAENSELSTLNVFDFIELLNF